MYRLWIYYLILLYCFLGDGIFVLLKTRRYFHEAAVGRIAPEEIEYLMARGLDEEEAAATIVRGFLNINIEGLPKSLEKKITDTLDTFTYNKGM